MGGVMGGEGVFEVGGGVGGSGGRLEGENDGDGDGDEDGDGDDGGLPGVGGRLHCGAGGGL